uniref:Uncharacterized protein n=1 Tax=Arundo donax TaxID=35708 RepID=A0A0A9B185_ARUDO
MKLCRRGCTTLSGRHGWSSTKVSPTPTRSYALMRKPPPL